MVRTCHLEKKLLIESFQRLVQTEILLILIDSANIFYRKVHAAVNTDTSKKYKYTKYCEQKSFHMDCQERCRLALSCV